MGVLHENVRINYFLTLAYDLFCPSQFSSHVNFLKPATYRETFEIPGKNGIIPGSLTRELSALAGLRNVLVHIYWDLDLDQVYEVLQRDLVYLEEFNEAIRKHLS